MYTPSHNQEAVTLERNPVPRRAELLPGRTDQGKESHLYWKD